MPTTASSIVPFAPPSLGPEEIAEVVATLESGWLSTGPRVAAFERQFAAYVGAPHAVAREFLHRRAAPLAARRGRRAGRRGRHHAADVLRHRERDRARRRDAGASPTSIPRPCNLDPRPRSKPRSPPRTRAILPVHYAGRPADMRAFVAHRPAPRLRLIEDAAHCVEGVDRRPARRRRSATSPASASTPPRTSRPAKAAWSRPLTSCAAAFMRTASLHGMSRDAWARYAPGGRRITTWSWPASNTT